MNLSKGKVDKSRMTFILQRHDSKKCKEDLQGVSSLAVWNALSENQDFRKSTDWVQRLAPDFFLLYGCRKCLIWPFESCHWYRFCNMQVDEGQQGFHENKYCDWRKPCCVDKWTWGADGKYRLICLGSSPDDELMSTCRYAFVGDDFPESLNNKMTFLKGCQALKQLNGREITKYNLLDMISEVNKQVSDRLSHLPEAHMIRSADPRGASDGNYGWSWKIVCEDARLSLPRIGQQIKVLDLNSIKDTPRMPTIISMAELELLLDVASASLDIENAPTSGPAERKMKNNIVWYNDNFKRARIALHRLNTVVDQVVPSQVVWSSAPPGPDEEFEEV